MSQFFDTAEAMRALEERVKEIPEIQRTLMENDERLKRPDRAAHQQQIAGGRVLLKVAERLPKELDGLGIFRPITAEELNSRRVPCADHIGVGRISTGMGCPHLETDPDFLGLMLAFSTPDGRRVDFIAINDPTAPNDTVEDFMALLKATADAAGTKVPFGDHGTLGLGNLAASQARLLVSLAVHAGLRAPAIAAHVFGQTARTVRSSTAYQPYWTGIVRAKNVLGKFTLKPTTDVNKLREISPGGIHFSMDWKKRQSNSSLDFALDWIPFLSETETPLEKLTKEWKEQHKVNVGTVTFPMTDPESTDAKLMTLLACEMGANPGNWIQDDPSERASELPATEFTAARFFAYRNSPKEREALPEESYKCFFKQGEISAELAEELVRRYNQKRAAGHAVPEVAESLSDDTTP
jgi:hypothetical protein